MYVRYVPHHKIHHFYARGVHLRWRRVQWHRYSPVSVEHPDHSNPPDPTWLLHAPTKPHTKGTGLRSGGSTRAGARVHGAEVSGAEEWSAY